MYVDFGDMVREHLHMQCQYASRYIHGKVPGYPGVLSDLRIYGGDTATRSTRTTSRKQCGVLKSIDRSTMKIHRRSSC